MKLLPAHLGSLFEIVEQEAAAALTWDHGRDRVIVDATTAHLLCAVLDELHGETRQRVVAMIEHSPAAFHQVLATARRCVPIH